MYESKNDPLLSRAQFLRRMLGHILLALCLIVVVVLIGVAAQIWLETLSWHDALLNTALIVGGIGPYILPESVHGKIFLSLYGMLIGMVFIGTLGLILAPIAHRIIHVFHLDDDN